MRDLGCLESGVTGMDKNHNLMSLLYHCRDFVITDEIHLLHLSHRVNLLNADECLRQRHRSETRIKVKQPYALLIKVLM